MFAIPHFLKWFLIGVVVILLMIAGCSDDEGDEEIFETKCGDFEIVRVGGICY